MTEDPVTNFFLALGIMLGAANFFGAVARRMGQPTVVGEIFAGLLASPMMLSGAVGDAILPSSVKPLLAALANVGIATFMFIIGYEMDGSFLRGRRRTVLGLTAGSVLIPLAGGIAVSIPLAEDHAPGNRVAFILFVGVAMSVTAFPVLARILADRGLNQRAVGGITLAAAAAGDLIAWICLAGVVAFAGASGQWRAALLPVYLILMLTVVRPLLARWLRAADRRGTTSTTLLPALIVGLMLSCAATEWLGIHFIFGAFAFGAVMPKAVPERIHVRVVEQIERAGFILLPLYFILAGTKVDLSGFDATTLGTLAAVIAVAIVTKAVGAYLGARLGGIPNGDALPIAILLNTRGLTEIVIVTVGLEMQLIDEKFYSMMVVMAVLTTAMTGPLLRLFGTGSSDLAAESSPAFGDEPAKQRNAGNGASKFPVKKK